MSVQVMGRIIDDPTRWPVSAGKLLVLLMVANHANADGAGAWPSLDRLANETRLSKRQVIRLLGELESEGYLTIDRGGGRQRTNRYALSGIGDNLSPSSPAETVTSESVKGDISAETVTPVSPEPSLEPSVVEPTPLAASPSANGKRRLTKEEGQERTALKDAFVAWSDYEPGLMTTLTWGRVERAAKEAQAAGYSAEDVKIAAYHFRDRYPDSDCTPQAILAALPMVPSWARAPRRRKARR